MFSSECYILHLKGKRSFEKLGREWDVIMSSTELITQCLEIGRTHLSDVLVKTK